MRLKTRAARKAASGALILGLSLALPAALARLSPPFVPQAPDYRHDGDAAAPVVIYEFSDFECPACRASVEPLKQLKALFPGKIRLVFKHLPWDFHKHAKAAAMAAECAGKQGRFWDFHDKLYASQEDWTKAEKVEPVFLLFAAQLHIEEGPFRSCLESGESAPAVEADIKEADDHWVRSTPTFIINGRRFVGAKQLRSHGYNLVERTIKP
ncbi:MAG: thioredoxin domain-containing protein [Elusimicrobiota bacterium]